VSLLAAVVAATRWDSEGWEALRPLTTGAVVAAAGLPPLLLMLYVVVAYLSRVAIIARDGMLVGERWHRRGSIVSVRMRRLAGGRRILRVVGLGRKPAVVAVPDGVTELEIQRQIAPLLRTEPATPPS
jgi:hypothetical protein